MHEFDREFERVGRQIDKARKFSVFVAIVGLLFSGAFAAAVIWAIIKVVNHYT